MSDTTSSTTYTPIPLTPALAPLIPHDPTTSEKKKMTRLLDTFQLLKTWLGFSQVERWQIEEEEARILLLGEEEEEEEELDLEGEEDMDYGLGLGVRMRDEESGSESE